MGNRSIQKEKKNSVGGTAQDPDKELLGYFGNDVKKLNHYLGLLKTCTCPFDVADRVLRPIYVEENLSPLVFSKMRFYGSFVSLLPDSCKFHPKSLYYQINVHLPQWKKERKEREEMQKKPGPYTKVDFKLQSDNSMDCFIHIHLNTVSPSMLKELESIVKTGKTHLPEKEPKRSETSLHVPLSLLFLLLLISMIWQRFC